MGLRKGWQIFLLILLLIGLSACSNQNSSGSTKDGLQIQFLKPDSIKSGQKVEYTVKLMEKGQPVKDAEVIVALEMVEMDHGKNGFRGIMTEPGVYKGEAVLPMGGDWSAYVKVNFNGVNTTQKFDFKVTGSMLTPEEMAKLGLDKNGAKKNPDF